MELTSVQVDKVVVIKGVICPYTVMETRDALKPMTSGQVLEIVSDYKPAATESIPNFCKKKNYPNQVVDNGDGTYRVLIQKTD